MVEADTYIRDTFERKIKGGGSMKNEEITWYKNRIIKLVKESEDLRLLKLIHRIAENLLGTVKER